MNKTAISKTLLTIYPGLSDYADMLGERAHTHALCSCNTPSYTERLIDKIIDLNVKQQTIRNLATQLTRTMEKLPTATQSVIHSYYQTYGIAQNIPEQAKLLGVAERTFYRHLDRATTFIAEHLDHMGINFFTWQDLLHSHAWIRETFTHQCQLNPQQTRADQTAQGHPTVPPRPHTKLANQTVA